ncbi:MAG: HAMP domain-containing histidine kinase [Deltaproteobacteria bacterium]|nr:HAMP domain-containing histidine kinase [Deltaproteobacteria bacterium]MCW5807318.1 HAMP domain-containing histidine kinase [Deltaproteobacteria bacterium]
MVVIVGCDADIDVDPRLATLRVQADELAELVRRQPPGVLIVPLATLIALPAPLAELLDRHHRAIPVIALLDEAGDAAHLPRHVQDYLVAPFATATTTARVEHVIRRARQDLQRSEINAIAGAHDARNRLFGISATVDALQAHIGPDPELAPFFDVLQMEVDSLKRLLADLLEYGRASVLDAAPGRIEKAVTDAVVLCRELAASSHTQISLSIAPDLPDVILDHHRLVQVFHNLMINAIQHAPRGRVSLALAAEALHGQPTVICRLRDDGPGFSADDLQRAFEPFYSRRAGGVGLGLAIVHRIVHAHDGWVHVANPDGGGAEITIRLPVTRTARPAST